MKRKKQMIILVTIAAQIRSGKSHWMRAHSEIAFCQCQKGKSIHLFIEREVNKRRLIWWWRCLWLYWFHCFIVIMGNIGACRCRVRALNERTKTTNQIQSIPCSYASLYAPTDMRITVKLYIWVLIHQTALFVESTNHFWFRRIARCFASLSQFPQNAQIGMRCDI